MARRFNRGGRRSAPRRATFWEAVSSTTMTTITAVAGVGSNVTAIVLESETDSVPNPTVVRVRGQIFAQAGAGANAQGDVIQIAHAIMVVDAKQLAIGVTAMPLPLTSNSEDFLWYGTQFIAQNDQTTVLNNSSNFDKLMVDSKAMRKMTLNQVLVMVTEIDVLQGGGDEDINFAFNLRVLFKK